MLLMVDKDEPHIALDMSRGKCMICFRPLDDPIHNVPLPEDYDENAFYD